MELFSNFLLDNLTYAISPRKKHKKRLATPEDYQYLNCTSLDAPVMIYASNSKTGPELLDIQMAQNTHPEPGELEESYDDDFTWAFKELITSAGHQYDDTYFKVLMDEAASITIRLKYRFNRPRPVQLAYYLGIDIKQFNSSTAKTPSFPSGHSAQSTLHALVLADQFPDLKDKLMKIADKVSESRLVGGHHFPSDIKYGEQLGQWLHQNCFWYQNSK